MKEMWDSRFAGEAYVYGTAPNAFLKQSLAKYKVEGDILFPAEGEGRNAVYAAKQGLKVSAFDISTEGQRKALLLANDEKVSIHYEVGNFYDLELINRKYNAAALIFAHFPPPVLSAYHQKIGELLQPGGIIILEGFSKNNLPLKQKNPKIGGPNNIDMLFTKEQIARHFSDFETLQLEESKVELNEGDFHQGEGMVVRFVGRKKKD